MTLRDLLRLPLPGIATHTLKCTVYDELSIYHISINVSFSGTKQGPHEKLLLNNLLLSYNNLERPVANESEPLEVKFGLTLLQIIDVVSLNENFYIL